MNALLIILAALVIATLLLVALKKPARQPGYRYRQLPCLLSKAERSFYGVLVQAVGESGLLFAKVRVADVLTPQKGLDRSHWQRAFNQISAKHFDFVICDPGDCAVKLAVELDDASHGAAKRVKRDALLDQACTSAGLPLLRIKAAKGYVIADIRQQIDRLLFPEKEELASAEPVPAIAVESVDETEGLESKAVAQVTVKDEKTLETASRECHKCGAPMVLQKAKAGKHAGQVFWGCSGFPECRAVVKAGVGARGKT